MQINRVFSNPSSSRMFSASSVLMKMPFKGKLKSIFSPFEKNTSPPYVKESTHFSRKDVLRMNSRPRLIDTSPPQHQPMQLDQHSAECLKKIRDQGSADRLYAILEINTHPYNVTVGDVVISKRLPDTEIGDVLTLTNAREIGSRDYFIRGKPLVDPRYFSVNAMVLEHGWSAKYTKLLRRKGRGPGDRKFRKRSYRDNLTTLRITDIHIQDAAPSTTPTPT